MAAFAEVRLRPGSSCVLRHRQKRLLRCVGTERRGSRCVGCTAAETSHRLHELANVARVIGGRVDGKPAKLPIQAHRTQARGSDKGVASNIVVSRSTAAFGMRV